MVNFADHTAFDGTTIFDGTTLFDDPTASDDTTIFDDTTVGGWIDTWIDFPPHIAKLAIHMDR